MGSEMCIRDSSVPVSVRCLRRCPCPRLELCLCLCSCLLCVMPMALPLRSAGARSSVSKLCLRPCMVPLVGACAWSLGLCLVVLEACVWCPCLCLMPVFASPRRVSSGARAAPVMLFRSAHQPLGDFRGGGNTPKNFGVLLPAIVVGLFLHGRSSICRPKTGFKKPSRTALLPFGAQIILYYNSK